MFQFCADQYECLEIFAKTQKGEKGSVSVRMLPDGEFLTSRRENTMPLGSSSTCGRVPVMR